MSEAIIKRWTSHNFNRPSVQIKDKPKIFENYIHNRRAKFALLTRGEFGSFFVALKHIANKHISSVGCRSPPYQSFLKTNKNKIDMEEK